MWEKFKWWWIKGSGLFVVFMVFMLFTGQQPFVQSSNSVFLNWTLSFAVAATPVGAIGGYFAWWLLKFVWELILSMMGIEKKDKEVDEIKNSPAACPFAGRILAEKDTVDFGFKMTKLETAFTVNDDWSVATPHDASFGWIDVNGEIHKGQPFGGIDPKATLAGGGMGLKIYSDALYAGNNKVGTLA